MSDSTRKQVVQISRLYMKIQNYATIYACVNDSECEWCNHQAHPYFIFHMEKLQTDVREGSKETVNIL